MNPQEELLNELTAYVERNFNPMHSVIIADAVEQFKQKLRLDAQEQEWKNANPKVLKDDENGILRDEYILHYRPKPSPPPLPNIEDIDEGIMYLRAGMVGIQNKPKALEYLYDLRKYLR